MVISCRLDMCRDQHYKKNISFMQLDMKWPLDERVSLDPQTQ